MSESQDGDAESVTKWINEDFDSVSDNESHKEHLRLAGIVKGVHADLRKKYKRSNGKFELRALAISCPSHCFKNALIAMAVNDSS